MLDSLKQAGKSIGDELSLTWGNLSDGWRELLRHSSSALKHFSPHKEYDQADHDMVSDFPSWGLIFSEVEETDKEIIVRLEIPGIDNKECRATIYDGVLYVSGEKHYERETHAC